ncbi:MAG: DUF4143 domain-containing protein [Dehalococcoidia bacterium]|nr:DUF4143 domain-containing protein [Dehalococcoidia bacterium]
MLTINPKRAFGNQVYYWRPDNRREIDFVFAPPQSNTILLEVKYQHNIDERAARHVAEAGGGFIATRSRESELAAGAVYALPTAELLLLLDTPSLAPCRP